MIQSHPPQKSRFSKTPTVILAMVIGALLITTTMVSLAQQSPVSITSDEQVFETDKGRTIFTGNVSASYKNVMIRGKKATVDVSPTGEPLLAKFYSRPHATRTVPDKGQDHLEADSLSLNLKDNILLAEGNSQARVGSLSENELTVSADNQSFDNNAKTVTATGNVKVNYEGTNTTSGKAILYLGEDGKAKRVVFTQNARLNKDGSVITSGKITVIVGSGNLVAESGAKTLVSIPGKNGPAGSKVRILANYQQFDKPTNQVFASGNVQIYYDDYIAKGSKANFKLKKGQIDSILLTGKPNIISEGRRVSADKITITVNPKHFNAYGNVKTQFQTSDMSSPPQEKVKTQAPPIKKTKSTSVNHSIPAEVKLSQEPTVSTPSDNELE